MTLRLVNRAANRLDSTIARITDHFNGNASRRLALHRQATQLADEVRRRRWVIKHARTRDVVGHYPFGHRLRLTILAQQHRDFG